MVPSPLPLLETQGGGVSPVFTWGPAKVPGGKMHRSVGDPDDWGPLGFSVSELATRTLQQFVSDSGTGSRRFLPVGFCSCMLWLSVSPCLSLPFGRRQFALWPHFSDGSKKSGCYFSLFSFSLVSMEWFLSSLHARWETRSSQHSVLRCIVNSVAFSYSQCCTTTTSGSSTTDHHPKRKPHTH